MNQSEMSERDSNMVQVLLINCLDLLNNEIHPDDHLEIITSSHFLLAEMYSMTNLKCEDGDCCESPDLVSDEEELQWPKVSTRFHLSYMSVNYNPCSICLITNIAILDNDFK